ncbi:VOC family protein [Bacillus salipaludis]|uniref:VOC family protein n=1 Tax=Bacillus salipaludis TaxID=2547811 RepID=UPI003D251766
MIKKVEHVGIMVSDMDESIKFYETLLDFKVRVRSHNGDKEFTFLTHKGLPGFEIELILDFRQDAHYSENGLVIHLAFVVEDMDSVVSYCKQLGIIFETSEPKRGINGRKTIRFRGLNGEMLQFVEERKISY